MSDKDRRELEALWTRGTMALDVLTRALTGASMAHSVSPDSIRAMTHYAAERLEWMQQHARAFREGKA